MADQASAILAANLTPAREIPTSFKESLSFWWHSSDKHASVAQERMLRRLSFFSSSPEAPPNPATDISVNAPTGSNQVVGRISKIELGSSKRFLNMFSITPSSGSTVDKSVAPPPTVILHGYGAGLGFFFLNFQALGDWAARRGGSIFALDWLGMGLSSRVPFRVKKSENVEGRVREAEDFFLDALEEWRVKQGIEKMNLVGHSLGGYLSAAYALRYPNRVSRLILLSPAGVPQNPDAGDAAIAAEARAKQSLTRKLLYSAWEAGWSPFTILRSISFYGPLLVGKYSSRRFAHLQESDIKDMNEYIWHISRAPGSGEYCISHLLAPGAFARLPLVDRVNALKVPVTFMYGEDDWMDPKGGIESVKRIRAAGNRDAKVAIVPYSGHHLYLDNPDEVNRLLIDELDRSVPRAHRTK